MRVAVLMLSQTRKKGDSIEITNKQTHFFRKHLANPHCFGFETHQKRAICSLISTCVTLFCVIFYFRTTLEVFFSTTKSVLAIWCRQVIANDTRPHHTSQMESELGLGHKPGIIIACSREEDRAAMWYLHVTFTNIGWLLWSRRHPTAWFDNIFILCGTHTPILSMLDPTI